MNKLDSGNPGDPNSFVVPAFETFDGEAKDNSFPFTPFSGGGVFDSAEGFFEAPDYDTNGELATAVEENGGDEFDFVSLAAGLDALVSGSPFLPAAGALALGLMAGAMAFAGIKRVARRA